MRDRTVRRLLTIGQLSELTGVPVRTIRFYSDSLADGRALLEPALRSAAGYRLYDLEAAARLELIRTLRDLGVDLPTIARVLARELTVAEVARAQADALEATVKALRLRQAVLRAVAVRDTDWEELELMNRLAKMDAEGRRRILNEFVDRCYEGLDDEHGASEAFSSAMRNAFPDLPQDPTERQVEAWVDLVELVQDEDFIARSREMAAYGIAKRAKMSEAEWQRDQQAFAEICPLAVEACESGIAADSAQGAARAAHILEVWCAKLDRAPDEKWRRLIVDSLTMMNDPRVNRFWQLVGIVGGNPELVAQTAPMYASMQWLIKALSADAGSA
ncbi:MerR family transcriptional regulator [Actinospica sp. MGRD01-02]|uniref:MerR family transcriptional regulator n=1 Tax=Actinospica acidithermotolerans TaxID=2828514 RepID=A0A941E555_9ACTN|nr:MerR family transcriptional regulator [Actinospica acidithermotolerans]MBR7826490.1 MerR family transcriptional regulator [Actinospica acidithermotolerans]